MHKDPPHRKEGLAFAIELSLLTSSPKVCAGSQVPSGSISRGTSGCLCWRKHRNTSPPHTELDHVNKSGCRWDLTKLSIVCYYPFNHLLRLCWLSTSPPQTWKAIGNEYCHSAADVSPATGCTQKSQRSPLEPPCSEQVEMLLARWEISARVTWVQLQI